MEGRARRLPTKETVEGLYREHGHVVLRRARALLGDEEEARDVVQEVFMSLLDRPDQFGGRSTFTTWLYAVTTHACLSRLRNRRTRERLLRERGPRDSGAPGRLPTGERFALVRQWLERLPEPLALVAVYSIVDGMTQQEIADQIGGSRRRVGDLLQQLEETRPDREPEPPPRGGP
jgi:RNA polymerase sigma-70 factor, ECF subfamily